LGWSRAWRRSSTRSLPERLQVLRPWRSEACDFAALGSSSGAVNGARASFAAERLRDLGEDPAELFDLLGGAGAVLGVGRGPQLGDALEHRGAGERRAELLHPRDEPRHGEPRRPRLAVRFEQAIDVLNGARLRQIEFGDVLRGVAELVVA